MRLAFAGLLVVIAAGCAAGPVVTGSGTVVATDLPVGEFQRVELTGSGDLVLVAGDAPGLTVEVDDNLVPHLDCRVDGDTLRLGWQPNLGVRTSKTPQFKVRYTDLSAVRLTGSGTVKAENLKSDVFAVGVSGSGEVTLPGLTVGTLKFDLAGSGGLTATGTADAVEVSVSGSGRVTADGLKAKAVAVKIAGSGDAAVWATDKLTAHVAGSGTVTYKGDPKAVDAGGSGSGKVRKQP